MGDFGDFDLSNVLALIGEVEVSSGSSFVGNRLAAANFLRNPVFMGDWGRLARFFANLSTFGAGVKGLDGLEREAFASNII